MEKNYSLNLPYPNVEGKISQKTMALLMEAYAGKKSEFTAINTYTYQHYFASEINKDLAGVLIGISVTEMKHLHLLGEAIVAFGGKPLYSGAYSFWNGAFVNYSERLDVLLQNDIINEKNAIDEYELLIESTDNDSLKKLIGRIIMDEQLHLTILETELNNL